MERRSQYWLRTALNRWVDRTKSRARGCRCDNGNSFTCKNEVQGWNHDEKADAFHVDMPLDRTLDDYDALLLPGEFGSRSTQTINKALEFIDGFL